MEGDKRIGMGVVSSCRTWCEVNKGVSCPRHDNISTSSPQSIGNEFGRFQGIGFFVIMIIVSRRTRVCTTMSGIQNNRGFG